MSDLEREDDRPDELTQQYRAAAAADRTRPSEAVRRAILAHANALSPPRAARTAERSRAARLFTRDFSWPIRAAASVAVLAVAGVLAWHAHVPATSSLRQHTAAPPPELYARDAAKDGPVLAARPREYSSANLTAQKEQATAERKLESPPGVLSPGAATPNADSPAPSVSAPQRSMHARTAAASPPAQVAPALPPEPAASAFAAAKERLPAVDWTTVGLGFPIPASMPRESSDDPLQAGFSPEWARRALKQPGTSALSADLQSEGARAPADAEALALAIMSRRRAPQDQWAHDLDRRLREVIRTEVDPQGPTVSRVFCNAVGCLCYTERDGADADAAGFGAVIDALTGATWARESGIDPHAVFVVGAAAPAGPSQSAVWQLVFVMRGVPPQG